ncbi:PAS domain-containing protein [Sulfurimonas sp.]|nr:PAS domain-containing protein [Sulfurimonas sp.]
MSQEELKMGEYDLIVSMTDTNGHITYVNDIFCKFAEYEYFEVMGQPHNMIRHPDMPKAVFQLLWNRMREGIPLFAFVKNKTKNDNYYWVKAFVFPIMKNGQLSKIVSYRKRIDEFAKQQVSAIYADLMNYESSHTPEESLNYLINNLKEKGLSYDQAIDQISLGKSI